MSPAQEASERDALPEISTETIKRIEAKVFADIGADRQRRRARRGRVWAGTGAAAALVVVAAIVGPSLVGGSGAVSDASNEAGQPNIGMVEDGAPIPGTGDPGESIQGPVQLDGSTAGGASSEASDAAGERELIASGSLSLRVDDIQVSAMAVADAAEERGGYVESLNIGADGSVTDAEGLTSMPAPGSGAWVQVRVPADQLTTTMEELSALGEVSSSNVSRQDVTDQAIDLRARVASAEASVARLLELMAQSGSVSDLIAAESALAERQATLESYQQQLEILESQVAMSSLAVDLTLAQETVEAEPAGFADGLLAGWNGVIATLNGVVIGLGFLLPWIVVVVAAGLAVWGIRRLIGGMSQRRRSVRNASDREGGAPPGADARDGT
ncbi:MAG TPA: DUF4349 domain-containing protein [Microbacterium sp.]|nr:DUF4349 domain-containing protein [Microbacterium sp.]